MPRALGPEHSKNRKRKEHKLSLVCGCCCMLQACSIVLSAIRQRSYQPSGAASAAAAVTSPPTGTPTATTTSSHNSSSSSGSKSSSSRSTSRSTSSSSTLAAQCGCLVVLCRHRSVRDLGQGGLLRQLRDSFLAGAPGGRLSTRERRLLLNTALRMVRWGVVRDEICFAHQSTAGGEG